MAITKRMRFVVLERDGFTCRYCKASNVALEVDHVIPRSLGGQDIIANLVAACVDCNRGKAANPVELSQVPLVEKMKALRPLKRAQLNEPIAQAVKTQQPKCHRSRRDEIEIELKRMLGHPYLSEKQLTYLHRLVDEMQEINREELERQNRKAKTPVGLQKYVRDINAWIGRGHSLQSAAREVIKKTGDQDGVREACEFLLERRIA
jgi:hypothetical protein